MTRVLGHAPVEAARGRCGSGGRPETVQPCGWPRPTPFIWNRDWIICACISCLRRKCRPAISANSSTNCNLTSAATTISVLFIWAVTATCAGRRQCRPRFVGGVLHGREPSPYMPTGDAAGAYHRIHSEIQMALHLSAVHKRREAAGMRPVNALWLWVAAWPPESHRGPFPLSTPTMRCYADTGTALRATCSAGAAVFYSAPRTRPKVLWRRCRPCCARRTMAWMRCHPILRRFERSCGTAISRPESVVRRWNSARVRRLHRFRVWRRSWGRLEPERRHDRCAIAAPGAPDGGCRAVY